MRINITAKTTLYYVGEDVAMDNLIGRIFVVNRIMISTFHPAMQFAAKFTFLTVFSRIYVSV